MQSIKRLIPAPFLKKVRPFYHGCLSLCASWWFGRPSKRMVVIGVTGTNGKTTTVNLIGRILQEAGFAVGYTSTATVNIDGQEKLNTMKMTMPSGWLLQKWMSQMVVRGCQYAVLEVSSEGLAQNRHLGIDFDVAVFTNLTPEHIESHGSFENYKKAKAKLFQTIGSRPVNAKKLAINAALQKTIITNLDNEHSAYYASFPAEKYVTYGIRQAADFQATDIRYSPAGVAYKLKTIACNLSLKGQFDVYNALAATAAAASQHVSLDVCKKALEKIPVVPGRMEVVQSEPFTVLVDYAYEPEEMRQLYETVSRWPHGRVLQVLGPTGGGRDSARISVLGKMAADFADVVVVTTDDPYDEDPEEIIKKMSEGATAAGKEIGKNLFLNSDRRSAFAQAFSLTRPGDLVLITGKGADQKMALAGGSYIDWDDRAVARQELEKTKKS